MTWSSAAGTSPSSSGCPPESGPGPMKTPIAGACACGTRPESRSRGGAAPRDSRRWDSVLSLAGARCLELLLGGFAVEILALHQPIGNVVLVGIAYVSDGLGAVLGRGHTLHVVEPDIAVEPELGRLPAERVHAPRPTIVGGEREEALVQLVHGLLGVVLIHHEPDVLHPRMDIGLGLGDVADFQLRAGGRHDLHDADGAHVAPGGLVQARLL